MNTLLYREEVYDYAAHSPGTRFECKVVYNCSFRPFVSFVRISLVRIPTSSQGHLHLESGDGPGDEVVRFMVLCRRIFLYQLN